MADVTTDIREEYFDNVPTGVEEETDDDLVIDRPWNPTDIRVSTKTFSLRNILDLIDDGDLDLAPDFQRNKVWKPRQKSRLIESVLLQIPLPAFYFAEDSNGMMRVVDGLQRLSTIHTYVRGGPNSFALTDLEYLKDHPRHFDDLPPALQRRINNAQIVVHVVDPTTPASVKYDIFKRINTGGTPLNNQEIRHCMSRDRSREFLRLCTHLSEFDTATGGRFKGHIRMDDREAVLRFCAFRLRGVSGYVEDGSMDVFLENTTPMLDDPKQVKDDELVALTISFGDAMTKSYRLFGDNAFRKWPLDATGRNPINRPLFECWSVVLDRYDLTDLVARKDAIVLAARTLMSTNRDYMEAITASTGDPRKVRRRFDLTDEATRAGL